MTKPAKVIIVTSALSGSGRTMISVNLATHLTQLGKVLYVGDNVAERGYFGELIPTAEKSDYFRAGYWEGPHNNDYPISNLYIQERKRVDGCSFGFKYDISADEEKAKSAFDFIVVSVSADEPYWKTSLAQSPDSAIIVYRHNSRSLERNSELANLFGPSTLVLPTLNFRTGSLETNLDAEWKKKSLETFGTVIENVCVKAAGNFARADYYYYNTCFSWLAHASYGAVNPSLRYGENNNFWSGRSVPNLLSYMQNHWE
jgi:hypothetical protein